MKTAPAPGKLSRDLIVAALCGVFVAAMVGLAYASVPLYDWFCRTTGFGGTPQLAAVAPDQPFGRKVTVRLDANIASGLPWRFEPETRAVEVRIGETVTVFYTVTNLSARPTTGQAAYNVTPPQAGGYFNKINCFCFTEQRLGPGEKREMPVVFFLDPKLAGDRDLVDLNAITLSYTFFPIREPAANVAERREGGRI